MEGTVEKLIYGGKGLLRPSEGLVTFVPFVIPGEKIRCQIYKTKKNYAEADLLEVLEKSPERQSPLCPYFGTCGGCQLQHMAYPLHVKHKQEVVQEAVQRVYPEAQIQMNPANTIWGYRRHITLTIKDGRVGYIGQDNQSLIEIETCPIFLSEQNGIFKKVTALIAQLEAREGKVSIVKAENQKFLLLMHFKQLPKNCDLLCKKALDDTLSGVLIQSPHKTFTFGSIELQFNLEGLQFSYHPAVFIQNHPEESAHIYRQIQAIVAQAKPHYLLDLYCGIGISSLLTAPFAGQIEAVEWNQTAATYARQNALHNNISNVLTHATKVEEILPKLLKKHPEMAIVNPPRTGLAAEVSQALAKSALQGILYISCQPATLARDLKVFKEQGFRLETGQAFDMFPQTGHVESLIHLKRQS